MCSILIVSPLKAVIWKASYMYIICIEYIQPWLLPSNSLLVLPVHILPPFYVPFGCCCLFVCLISGPLSPTVHGCAVIHWEWQPYQLSHCQKIVILPSPEATSCQWSSARVGALGATCSNFKLFLDVLKLKCNYVVSLLPIFSATPPIYHLLQSLKFMA